MLARINAERCHASVLHWETMRDMMYSDGGGRVSDFFCAVNSCGNCWVMLNSAGRQWLQQWFEQQQQLEQRCKNRHGIQVLCCRC